MKKSGKRFRIISLAVLSVGIVVLFFSSKQFQYLRAVKLILEHNRYYHCTVITSEGRYLAGDTSFHSSAPQLCFMATGDAGSGGPNQQAVSKIMASTAKKDAARFVLFLGDNFYPTGTTSVTDKQWQSKFEKMYAQPVLQIPFYAVLGNHDYRSNPESQIEYSKGNSRWIMPAHYYQFNQKIDSSTSVDFFALDTPVNEVSPDQFQKEITWLEAVLQKSTAKWKIVFGHHPVFSHGQHGSTPFMIQYVKPLLEKYHVDAYVSGHDHNLQLFKPVNGVHYIVSGGGGQDTYYVFWEQDLIFAHPNRGIVLFRFLPNLLRLEFINHVGLETFAYSIKK